MSKLTDMLDKYRGLDKVALRVGIMGNETYPDGTSVAGVGYTNEYGTDTIPSRPFFRSTIANERSILPNMTASLVSSHGAEAALRQVGEHMVSALSESVQTWSEPPNSPSTIRAKGYNAPLRGPDLLLRNSFSYEIEK